MKMFSVLYYPIHFGRAGGAIAPTELQGGSHGVSEERGLHQRALMEVGIMKTKKRKERNT
jgi:hypothetical protein